MDNAERRQELLSLTTEIVASFAGNNPVAVNDLPGLISSVYTALSGAGSEKVEAAAEPLVPAVPIKKSIQPDYIVCLEDGKKLKLLKRYLASRYNMTPDDYRRRWGLPGDYPMVAPAYADRRSALAKEFGLGRKAAPAPRAAEPEPAAKKAGIRRVGGRRRSAA